VNFFLIWTLRILNIEALLKMQAELEMGEEKLVERELNRLLEVTLRLEYELEAIVRRNN